MKFAFPTRPLSELAAEIDYGVTASALSVDTGTKFLRITDIQDGSVDWLSVPFCQAPQSKLRSARLDDGDIVFARTGATTGKSLLIKSPPDGAVFASYLIRVKPSHAVDPSYLAHFFQSPSYWNQIEKKTQGAAQGGVNATSLSELQIPVPKIDEQRRIAAILDKTDMLHRKRKRALELLNGLTQSIFLEMFGAAGASGKSFRLEEITELKRGPFGGALKKEIFVKHGFLVYEQGTVISNDPGTGRYFIDKNKYAAMMGFSIQPNDILITCSGTLGAVMRIKEGFPEGIINQALLRVRPNLKKVRPEFLEAFFKSNASQDFFDGFARGTGLKNFPPMSEVRSMPVSRVSIDRQDRFLACSRGIQNHTELAMKSTLEANHLFSSLQHRAFSGQL